jgi:hypothetical protein
MLKSFETMSLQELRDYIDARWKELRAELLAVLVEVPEESALYALFQTEYAIKPPYTLGDSPYTKASITAHEDGTLGAPYYGTDSAGNAFEISKDGFDRIFAEAKAKYLAGCSIKRP